MSTGLLTTPPSGLRQRQPPLPRPLLFLKLALRETNTQTITIIYVVVCTRKKDVEQLFVKRLERANEIFSDNTQNVARKSHLR